MELNRVLSTVGIHLPRLAQKILLNQSIALILLGQFSFASRGFWATFVCKVFG